MLKPLGYYQNLPWACVQTENGWWKLWVQTRQIVWSLEPSQAVLHTTQTKDEHSSFMEAH
jgi:hypothetical protein